MTKQEMTDIVDQWEQPSCWQVKVQNEKICVYDEDKDFVVSSILHSHVRSSIEEHLQDAKEVADMDLLLSLYGKPES